MTDQRPSGAYVAQPARPSTVARILKLNDDAVGVGEEELRRVTFCTAQPPTAHSHPRDQGARCADGVTSGLHAVQGTLWFSDLEDLPRHSQTTLLQCGVPEPTGIVTWTGVRFSDFAEMIGVQPAAHYCRVISHDGYWVDEEMPTMMHPQVMLAWLINDQPIPPINGAPLRLVIAFRYGARSVKAVSEITFGSPSLPNRTAPTRG